MYLRTVKALLSPRGPQRSNAARVRNMNRFNGGKLPGNSKHFFKTSKDKAVPGKASFKRWVSVEKFLFFYLWLYRLVLCSVTVFPARLFYELRSVNALNWYRFSRHWQPDVTYVLRLTAVNPRGACLISGLKKGGLSSSGNLKRQGACFNSYIFEEIYINAMCSKLYCYTNN